VLALQASHPTISAGIEQHSRGFEDPLGRVRETFRYLMEMLFGCEREATAAEIRQLHRGITGTGYDGKRYHAWNREAWTWVHLSAMEAILYALETLHGRLPVAEQEAFYRETRAMGMLYNVRDQDMPGDVAGLHRYIADQIEHRLCATPLSERILAELRDVPSPRWLPIPRVAWRLSRYPLDRVVYSLIFGPFPATVRHRWGLRWSALDEAQYRAQVTALRLGVAPLPDRLRMIPSAYHALRAAG
jgi:uncharacterized protein (DUF2236 family)